METAPLFVDTATAAQLLGRSKRTLCDWRIDRRGPPFTRRHGRAYYRVEDLVRWGSQSEPTPPAPAALTTRQRPSPDEKTGSTPRKRNAPKGFARRRTGGASRAAGPGNPTATAAT